MTAVDTLIDDLKNEINNFRYRIQKLESDKEEWKNLYSKLEENLEGEINRRDAILKQIGYTFLWGGEEPAYCCDYCDFPLGEGHADGCQNPSANLESRIEAAERELEELKKINHKMLWNDLPSCHTCKFVNAALPEYPCRDCANYDMYEE